MSAPRSWRADPNRHLSENFRETEFACNHCGMVVQIQPRLIELLQQVRTHFGSPLSINSGYRCPVHNANVGGARNSQHLTGFAADIRVANRTPRQVADYLETLIRGRHGMGRYRTFTHLDTRAGGAARWGSN